MSNKRIADLLNVSPRFLRSIQLERDFRDSTILNSYVFTDFAKSCFGRIAEGLNPESGQRAWRITGDYGSGKSSFALLLAHLFAGRDDCPAKIRCALNLRQLGVSRPHFIPVLTTCSRLPLSVSILKSLHHVLCQLYTRGNRTTLISEVESLLHSTNEPTEEQVITLVERVNTRLISDAKGNGLLFILDELGKFLEFAALHPQRQDIFLLQRLAEVASRSGDKPLFIVCLLHQGFSAYADQLSQTAQREWEKIAGRFDEIVFNQPVEQVGSLIASALNVKVERIPRRKVTSFRRAMVRTIELNWFGMAQRQPLIGLAARLYPLHPTVLPVLIRVFRRFGQNERSLFSFLLSNEPFGLQVFCDQYINNAPQYRLYNLFDYVRTNFGHRLAMRNYRSHWILIESVIESYATDEPIEIQVLKTIGMLNLLNDDLLATEESVVCAVAGNDHVNQRRVKAAIDKLRRVKRVLYDRGQGRGLCLWPHTSVDLEKAHDEACRAIQTPEHVASLIKEYLEMRPIVARRHYIETGNLRYFDIRYSSVSELPGLLNENTTIADGLIVVPLCETVDERFAALEYAKNSELEERRNWLLAVPQPLRNLASLVQEVQRWEWIATNTIELNADKYAREEVYRQRQAARLQLEVGINARIGFKQFGERTTLEWFYQGRPLRIRNGRHLLSELSRILDEVYTEAPHIHNELVNRRNLSTAAASARMRLLERMFADGKSQWLGMNIDKKPPEMSMYLSVLMNTGIHQKKADAWKIGEPSLRRDKRCHVLPTLRKIREIVRREPEARVNIATLFEELRQPPFGVRDGLIPLLLSVFAIGHEKDVAFFKDGTFIREMSGETMLLLTKAPERFEIQYYKIGGVRAELFEKLLAVLEIKQNGERKVKLLDIVKPLCVFVAQLPAYVHNTKKLSNTALSVRNVILDAREPARLLFADLPKACGFKPFSTNTSGSKEIHAFIRVLKTSLDELRAAYPELQERLRILLRESFDMPGPFQKFRVALAVRGEQVLLGVNEPKLRSFCLRLMDNNLPESEWLESLGSFLALTPPTKWHDAEEDLFAQELGLLAARFHRVESIVFADRGLSKNGTGIRIAITQADGNEHEQVIHFNADEEHKLRDLQAQFESLLAKDKRLGLAAVSRAVWVKLERGDKTTDG